MPKIKESKKSSKERDLSKKILDKEFLKRISHLKGLLRDLKDETVKEEVKKDIEDIKDEIQEKDFLKFDIKLVEEALARAENTVKKVESNRDDYGNQFLAQRGQERPREDSILESTVRELARDLPKREESANIGYGASNIEYGTKYLENYGLKYSFNSSEEERKRRESESKMTSSTSEYMRQESLNTKDIYITERKKLKS